MSLRALLLAVLFSGCSLTQELLRSGNGLPAYTHDEGTWRELDVPMRDGVKLRTHVLMPRGVERAPVVLMRNPYPRDLLFTVPCGMFARYGIGCVVQDVRGQRESPGEWSPFTHELADGEDTLAWLDAQPFAESIALYGASYLAGTALAMSGALPPKVKTMVLAVFGADLRPSISERGLFPHELLTVWSAYMPGRERPGDVRGAYARALAHRPHLEADVQAFSGRRDWYRDWLDAALPGAPLWQSEMFQAFQRIPARIEVPVLYVEGFDDPFLVSGLDTFSRLGSRDRSLLALLPTTHVGLQPGAVVMPDAEGQYLWKLPVPWVRHHLQGVPLPFEATGVTSWARGDDAPRHRASWPPPARDEVLVLQPAVVEALPCPQRALGGAPGVPALLSYRYNPDNPWRGEGGARSLGLTALIAGLVDPGPALQTWACRRDVVRFVTPPLKDRKRLAGRARVSLAVRSSAKDTAFYAKLVDIDPRGRAVHVTDGAATLRLPTARDATPVPYEPNAVRTVELDLWPTEWVLEPGHRLGLWVSSSNWPTLSAHLNTEEPWFRAQQALLAEQTLELGGPSVLSLPVTAE
jgi:putative CocE/NonD family hydrolase